MAHTFTFLKLVEQEEHALRIRAGLLHLNTVRHFKEYRDLAGELRGDPFEGVHGILQPDRLSHLSIADINIPPSDLRSPLLIHRSDHLDWRVFCAFALGNHAIPDDTEFESLDHLKELMLPDHITQALGAFAVVFTKPLEFVERVRAALTRMGVQFRFDLVEYYDETKFHGMFKDEDVPFRKRLHYASQREYRIAFRPHSATSGVVVLDVGDLSDMVVVMPVLELASRVTLEVDEGA